MPTRSDQFCRRCSALAACAAALQEFPELNARLEGDEIVYLDRYDLGVAVQTEQGLVVPVVREGEIVVRPIGTIAVTFDHRVVDGARAAEFGLGVIRRLEA